MDRLIVYDQRGKAGERLFHGHLVINGRTQIAAPGKTGTPETGPRPLPGTEFESGRHASR